MAMIVHNNMEGIRTLNLLNKNNSQMAKDLKKISTGMKITSAGDDSSAYAISERMRVRIRGLEQCSQNVSTGRNMLSVAAQAVGQQVDILGKLRETALKASDDTYAQKDRDILVREADQLFDQLEHIAQETSYNGVNLLNRTSSKIVEVTETQNVFAPFDPMQPATRNTKIGNLFPSSPYELARGWDRNHGETLYGYCNSGTTVTLDFSSAASGTNIPDDFDLQGFSCLCTACCQFVSIVFTAERDLGTGELQNSSYSYTRNGTDDSMDVSQCRQYIIGINGANTAQDIEKAVYDGIIQANGGNTLIGKHDLRIGYDSSTGKVFIKQSQIRQDSDPLSDYEIMPGVRIGSLLPMFFEGTKGMKTDVNVVASTLSARYVYDDLTIQSDTKASQSTKIRLWNTTLDALFPPADTDFSLEPDDADYPAAFNEADYPDPNEHPDRYEGYTGTALQKKQQLWRDTVWSLTKAGAKQTGECLRTRQGAQDFLDDLDQALKYCLSVGTSLGSQMMRMQISDANIMVNHENTTAAESTIRDADMAKEMVSFTKSNILLSSSQAMLSHANQDAGNVLSLLQ